MAEENGIVKDEKPESVPGSLPPPSYKETDPLSVKLKSKDRVTAYLVLTAVTCFLGSSFQFGYNLGVINAPEEAIKAFLQKHKYNNIDELLWPTAVAIFAVGGMFGALTGPHCAKIIGRKKTLMANNLIAILGGIFLFITKSTHSVALLIIGRIVVGVNCVWENNRVMSPKQRSSCEDVYRVHDNGVNTVVAPMYLSEIAPVRLRGALGTLNQFGIVTGLLISQVLGLSQLLGNASGWHILLGLTAVVAALQLFVLPFCPESPRYLLIMCGKEAEAEQTLKKLRGIDDVSADIQEMMIERDRESTEERVSIIGLFTTPSLQRPLLISLVLQLSQQLSGINGVLFYSTKVFLSVGVSQENSQAATTGVGAVSVILTAIVVKLVEMKGRRTLMLWGLGGMFIFYILMVIAFVYVEKGANWAKVSSVVLTLVLVIFFQLGPGPIPWFIVAELFSQGPLPAAISLSGIVNWLASFAVGQAFPPMQKNLHPYTFIPFIVLVLGFWLFTYFYVPETKGKTINQIMAEFEKRQGYDRITTDRAQLTPLLDSASEPVNP